jgi:hypothetical protein
MGYRSDVAYTIRFTKAEDYHLFVLEAKTNPEVAGALGDCTLDDDKMRIDFNVTDIKWYDSYPEVQMHEKLIAQAESWCDDDTHIAVKEGGLEASLAPYRVSFIFVRIGENIDDVEERHGGDYDWEWLHVSRRIEGDFPD